MCPNPGCATAGLPSRAIPRREMTGTAGQASRGTASSRGVPPAHAGTPSPRTGGRPGNQIVKEPGTPRLTVSPCYRVQGLGTLPVGPRGAFASATHRSRVCPLGSGRPSATVGVATRPRRQWAERSRSAPLHPLQCGSPPKRTARIRKKTAVARAFLHLRRKRSPFPCRTETRMSVVTRPLPEVPHLREGSTKARMSVS